MSASIEIPFQIGGEYWLPVSNGQRVEIVCPVCAGNRAIVVTLGDGEKVSVPCEGCGLGYEGPRGYVSEHRYEPAAQRVSIVAVDSMREGKWCVRIDDGRSIDFESLFLTEAEAMAKSRALTAEAWERVMESHQRKRQVGNVGWTVRYHRQQIAALKKQLEWHEQKVRTAK